jgi:hypothetical protein
MADPILDEEVVRKGKLEKLEEMGVNPYPSKVNKKTDILAAKEKVGEKFWIPAELPRSDHMVKSSSQT